MFSPLKERLTTADLNSLDYLALVGEDQLGPFVISYSLTLFGLLGDGIHQAQPRARAFPNIPVTGSGGPWLPMKTT